MPLQTACTSCSAKLRIKDELIDKFVKCPKCGVTFKPVRESPEFPSPEITRSLATSEIGGTETLSFQRPDGHTPAMTAKPLLAPEVIGRYRVEKVLGEGGFGIVYLAHDDELKRRVAIKVPQPHRIRSPKDAEAYLVEAQILAKLDHPHIVPVHDVGRSQDGLPYVVSKYIEGSDLATRLKQDRLSIRESAILISRMAEALQYAHQHRLVHRDVKPGNILIDTANKPFLVDFGLALKEEDFGKDGGIMGTPAYMSPEQACGEGHLVDGRSDIFSLGVILYELLAGSRPFQADSIETMLFHIATVEPRPLRQIAPAIPKELERITLKSLAKKASERYPTALDFSDDLQHWLKPTTTEKGPAAVKIIPKGLRSFDAEDTDFFLELLPGPRDRDGLPETLRFWKTKIEEKDADKTFRVGVIYGPSGCGKSSFVKAGLLPRLANTVRVVYVEATPEGTEARLMRGLEKACPDLPKNLSLREAIAHLRREVRLRHKVVLVVDQFEQWLHSKNNQENAELIQALRQCDGERVQCIVMVRDDFWMALTRFMKELEIRLVEGQNSAAVDLFDLRHAQKVLTAFGTAYGTLPDSGVLTKDQETFLESAVSGLGQDGKVISVRLALFAEMVKGKPWTPATFKEIGGTEGVGVTFLEETFSATTAPPEHRYHQKAARAVLNALLPEQGTDIKGQMRSHADLLEASGYAARPKDFEELLTILNSEVRLITPTDPAGAASEGEITPVGQYYQLTHDYLVHSLRDWLTRKQKETRRGLAELLLADRAAVWNARPENRQLPSLLHWLQIHWLTAKKTWTVQQRKMMTKAGRYHAVRGMAVGVLLAVTTFTGLTIRNYVDERVQAIRERAIEQENSNYASALVGRVFDANISQVPDVVKEMEKYRAWTDPLLKEGKERSAKDPRKQLHASLALLPVDAGQVEYLYGRLLKAKPQEVVVIRGALLGHKSKLMGRLWTLLENPKNDQDQRFRAACALSVFAPDDARWQKEKVSGDVAAMLVVQKPFEIAQWSDALTGVGIWLLPPLADILLDENRSVSERGLVATVYGKFTADIPAAYTRLENRLTETAGPDATLESKIILEKEQASIGSALVVMGQSEKVWPLMKHSPDPTLRSFLIDRMQPMGVDPKVLMARLEKEQEVSVKRAILLSLGEYKPDRLSIDLRLKFVPQLLQFYRDDPDPGIHSAVEWLLRQWQASDEMQAVDKDLATGKVEGQRQWYLNRQGQTMVVIPKPGAFWMGEGYERKQSRIDRNFAIASKEVTVDQFLRFRKEHQYEKEYTPTGDCPLNSSSWYEAAAYCNWLSEQEGIPKDQWWYEPNKAGKYEAGMTVPADFLQRTGYRLPTEVEWEYACRAGADTGFSLGDSEELLGKYSWFERNSLSQSHPVGSLRANDLGLFDMHGNLWEWCQDTAEMNLLVKDDANRVLRGGSFDGLPSYVRSATREYDDPSGRTSAFGFRAARTLPLIPLTSVRPTP
jgi:formylglycine-generating enzyme required for sulfatase activity/predicted Ser/Thr protein kinase